jgi:pimeloyl-ACP methyl ester carboxylesterase
MGRRRAHERTAGRLPARGPGLDLDVEGFPREFCAAHGLAGFVFSRYGYGNSTPKPRDERWPVDFMTQQANEVLPALFAAVGIVRPWLFGHSDGGTIALLHAASHPAAGVIAVAPHLFVEEVSVKSIELARDAFESSDLRARLARHHADPDSAFRGWNDAWLAPEFRDWNIERRHRDDRLPGAGRPGRRRRVRHAGANPRRRASIAEDPLAR